MSKTIELSDYLEKRMVQSFLNELNYKIKESGCAHEYHDDIMVMLELLKAAGYDELVSKMSSTYVDELQSLAEDGDMDYLGTTRVEEMFKEAEALTQKGPEL